MASYHAPIRTKKKRSYVNIGKKFRTKMNAIKKLMRILSLKYTNPFTGFHKSGNPPLCAFQGEAFGVLPSALAFCKGWRRKICLTGLRICPPCRAAVTSEAGSALGYTGIPMAGRV